MQRTLLILLPVLSLAAPACERQKTRPPAEDSPARAGDAPRDGSAVAEDAGPRAYTCAMHPEVERDAPGTCPLGGMELVPAEPTVTSPALPDVAVRCGDGGCRVPRAEVRRLLDEAARSRDAELRSVAVVTLPMAKIRQALQDPAWIVRAAAAYALGEGGDGTSLRALQKASKDARDDPQGLARLMALDARLRLGDASAAAALRPWISRGEATTRMTALSIAAEHRVLMSALRLAAQDPSPPLEREWLEARLALAGDAGALEAIKNRWDRDTYLVQVKRDRKRARAHLERLASNPKPPPASQVAKSAWYADRLALAEALVEAGSAEGRRLYRELLERAARAGGFEATVILDAWRRHAAGADRAVFARWIADPRSSVRVRAAAAWWAATQ